MYEEHDTDARTHATDLNGVGDTDMEFRRGFWDFTILFYYHEEIIHPPSSDILAYLLLQPAGPEPRHRLGTTHFAPAVLHFSVSLWITSNLSADASGAIARGKPRRFPLILPFWRRDRRIGPDYQTPFHTPACLIENSRFIDLGCLLLKFTLESVMMDSGQREWEFLHGPVSVTRG